MVTILHPHASIDHVSLSNFEKKLIFQSHENAIYRGIRKDTQQTIILKQPNRSYFSIKLKERYAREYAAAKLFSHPNIAHYERLENTDDSLSLILQDTHSIALRDWTQGPIALTEFFQIARELLEGLNAIHQQNVVHNAINPSHILIQEEALTVQYIGLAWAQNIHQLTYASYIPETISMLSYMAPEYVQHSHGILDYRSDLYSIGVIFYELLTGRLPFLEKEPEALLHAQLAKKVPPPHLINPQIPINLSNLILKLLAKKPEFRYQSALGIKLDLLHCQSNISNQKNDEFVLGQFDFSVEFKMSEKLYGREKELEQLNSILNSIDPVGVEVLLVRGYSGVGKTTLLRALEQELAARGGYFAMGKFGQQKQNIAYGGLSALLGHLIKQLLSEEDASVSLWREKILTALGTNAQIITDIVPELKSLIGVQPALAELSPIESQSRFNYVFQQFINVFSNENQSLVLFLDDLQWADLASLDALKLMLDKKDDRSLLLIGTYRDNEIDTLHPLNALLEKIQHNNIRMHEIQLKPLQPEDVAKLISEAMHCQEDEVEELCNWVYQKTAGNPFYIKSFLRVLYENGLIYYSKEKYTWVFDIASIKTLPATQNVGEFMARRFAGLSQDLQYILEVAACFGNRFDKNLLECVLSQRETKLEEKLLFLVAQGLLINKENTYYFVHDQVQGVALAFLKDGEKNSIHLHIGLALLTKLSDNEQDEKISLIVDHLNRGRDLIKNKRDLVQFLELNLKAAIKVKGGMAYKAAFDYLESSKIVIENDSKYFWQEHYQITFYFLYEFTDLCFLVRKNELAEFYCELMLNNADSSLDKCKVLLLRIKYYVQHDKLNELIKYGIYALSLLGVKIPKNPSMFQIKILLRHVKILMNKSLKEKDLKKIIAVNPLNEVVMKILMGIIPATHAAGKFQLTILFAVHATRYCLRNGFTYSSSYMLLVSAAMFNFILKEPKLSHDCANLAFKLNEFVDNKLLIGRLNFLYSVFIGFWNMGYRQYLNLLELSISQTKESVDFLYYSSGQKFNFFSQIYKSDLNYHDLQKKYIAIEKDEHMKYASKLDKDIIATFRHFTDCLHHEKRPLFLIKNMVINNTMSLMCYHLIKSMICYHFGEYKKSYLHIGKTKKGFENCAGTPTIMGYYTCCFLSAAALLESSSSFKKPKYLLAMRKSYKQVKFWYNNCPESFAYYLFLMQAQWAEIFGQYKLAAKRYSQAIEVAGSQQFLLAQAFAAELAGRFYAKNGNEKVASIHMQEARSLYQQWGGQAKVKFLEKEYSNLLPKEKKSPEIFEKNVSFTEHLDMQTVLKTSHAISSTLELEKLLLQLLEIMLKNTGAENGYFIQSQNETMQIIAAIENDTPTVFISSPQLLENASRQLAVSVVNYVKHTHEVVVLSHAAKSPLYQNDVYIKENEVKSVLCWPILKQKDLLGILYLENNLATDVFTDDKVALLKMLSTQAAISLENAMLYESNQKAQQKIQQHQTEIAHYSRLNTMSELATGLAHEINQPLFSSLNYLGGCLERLKQSGISPDIISGIEQAANKIESAGEIIHRLRASLKKQTGSKVEVEFNALINNVLSLFSYKIKANKIKLKLNFSDDLPILVADKIQLEQVLTNLISNAIEALIEVEIHRREIMITTEQQNKTIKVRIKDSGPGIASEIQTTLFQPFMTTKTNGLGMGLAICQTIIENYHGKITVNSQINEGAEFCIIIPIQ